MLQEVTKGGAVCALGLTAPCLAEEPLPAAAVAVVSVQPAQDESAASWLEPAAGEWYDLKGELAMTISGSTINGCPVAAAGNCTYGYPRTGHFTISESQGTRALTLDLLGHKSHQYLIVDGKTALRRSIHPEYSESVGGIYLGMTRDDVTAKYGYPNEITADQGMEHWSAKYGYPNEITADQGMEHWSYGLHRMDVFFQGGIVMAVRLYKGSDIKFDKSGLGADAAMAAYAEAYKLAAVPVIPADDGILSPSCRRPTTCLRAKNSTSASVTSSCPWTDENIFITQVLSPVLRGKGLALFLYRTLHGKIDQDLSCPMNALPADDGVASPLKKRPGRQGGVGADLRMAFGGGAPFDAFRQGFGDAAALVVLVDVEAVEVLAVPVGESDDTAVLHGDPRVFPF